jgi:hypothetical protein
LIELGENGRDLSLTERVVKRVVNGLRQDVQARSFLAVDIHIDLQTIWLLVSGNVSQFGQFAEPI